LNGQNPSTSGNTTYIRFKDTDVLKENPENLIKVFEKYESKIEFDKDLLKQLREKNIGKTFDLVLNKNTEREEEFETIIHEICIELRKLGYKV